MSNYLSKRHFHYGKYLALAVVALCFLVSYLQWNNIINASASYQLAIESGEYWRLFTTTFVHGDLDHFLSNSFMLFVLTYFVTSFYGYRVSLVFAYTVGILINTIVLSLYSSKVTLVGASGVVYYLWGFWLFMFLVIQRHMSWISRLLRVGAIFFILLIPTTYNPQTSYLAHYVGFILGGVSGLCYFLFEHKKIRSYETWHTFYNFEEYIEDEYENNFSTVD